MKKLSFIHDIITLFRARSGRIAIHAMRACRYGIWVAVMCGMLLTACGGQEDVSDKEDEKNETDGYSSKSWPDIQVVDLEGEASVTWQSCESLGQLEEELSQWTNEEAKEDSLELFTIFGQ